VTESQRQVRELEVEVKRQQSRAEHAEHERNEYRAVIRLAAEGEDVRDIARAVLAKWADAQPPDEDGDPAP
jgi:hypothetical protein